jgi:hypothetical protein
MKLDATDQIDGSNPAKPGEFLAYDLSSQSDNSLLKFSERHVTMADLLPRC